MSQWYAIRTATRRERPALASLTEQGFAAFLPCETRWNCDRLGKDLAYSPVYPGYLFAMLKPGDFERVAKLDHIYDLVRYTDNSGDAAPMPIPMAAIIEIQASERAGRYDRTLTRRREYRPRKDERVQVTAGPWLGFIAKVLSTPRGQRAQLMIEGPFGRGVTLDVAHLRVA